MRDVVDAGAGIVRIARRAVRNCVLAAALLALVAPALEAQDDPTRGSVYAAPVPAPPAPYRIWAAYGTATPFVFKSGDPQGLAHSYRLGIGRGSSALVLQYETVDEAFGPGTETLSDIGALWAKSWGLGPVRGTGAIGLSRLSGFECVSDDDDPNTCNGTGTFAFPGYVQLDWNPLPFIGVGAYFSATVSPDGNWGSVGVVGRVGKLR